ncbi:hypothetical protein [Caballeronia grimmiae]|uniref:hypothetical protein n=1 Tax=Caballeronia grimmiae TaxID=1071679 RepID=UPI001268412E|nr:hypothetical protein [Caballeronia grimmiae]
MLAFSWSKMALDNFLPRDSLAEAQLPEANDAATVDGFSWNACERPRSAKPSVTLWDEISPETRSTKANPADDFPDA